MIQITVLDFVDISCGLDGKSLALDLLSTDVPSASHRWPLSFAASWHQQAGNPAVAYFLVLAGMAIRGLSRTIPAAND